MTSQQSEMWQRLQSFSFDPPDARVRMIDKIAREQAWTITFAERAVDEYRRYLLLAKFAGHPVSPSGIVDIVWHWHLLYTRSYWDNLCGQVLLMQLHHQPSTGNVFEEAKFDDWYARTLKSYRAMFDAEPPADIWPSPGKQADDAAFARKVDARRYWVIPRSRSLFAASLAMLLLMLLLWSAGCDRASDSTAANPLDMNGPTFLKFYLLAVPIGLIVAWLVRRMLRQPTDLPPAKYALDAYQIAYLRGGAAHAVNTALAVLARRHAVSVHRSKGTIEADATSPTPSNPLERAIFSEAQASVPIRNLRAVTQRETDRLDGELTDQRLLLSSMTRGGAHFVPMMIAFAVPVLGLAKIAVGLSRGRPVGFLIMLSIATFVLSYVLFGRYDARTIRGSKLLASLRGKHQHLRLLGPRSDDDRVALGVAIFGLTAVSSVPALAHLPASLPGERRNDSSGGGSSCGGSSCSGSSCGSSCGGGGCGGCGSS